MYSPEPIDKHQFTTKFNRVYSQFAKIYDLAVKWIPLWRNWISHALPHLRGQRILEISYGTGYLLTQYADRFETYGIDYNWELACTAKHNLQKTGIYALIQQANIEHLPYQSKSFDTVVNTMAFTGYPDGQKALSEISRVLKDNGRFVLIDINYPKGQNWLGMKLTQLWASSGDIIRDMGKLFKQSEFEYSDDEVGGFGSVHLYVATKAQLWKNQDES